jgi:hypothetical protein
MAQKQSFRSIAPLACLCCFYSLAYCTAQERILNTQKVVEIDPDAGERVVEPADLHDVELDLQRYFERRDAPDELFALCWGDDDYRYFEVRGEPTWYDVLLVRGDRCELRTYDGVDPRRFARQSIAPSQLARFREVLQEEKFDALPNYTSDRILPDGSGTQTIGAARYMLIHMTASKGRRLYIHNPPSASEASAENPGGCYRRLISAFEAISTDGKGEMIYDLDRPIDGLKAVYARGAKDAIAIERRDKAIVVALADSWDYSPDIEYRVVSEGKVGQATTAREVKKQSDWIKALDLSPCQVSSDGRFVVGNLSVTGELACYNTRTMKRVELPAEAPRLAQPLYYLDAHAGFLLAEFPIERVGDRSRMSPHDTERFRVFKPSLGKTFNMKELLGSDSWSKDLAVWLHEPPMNLQIVDPSNVDVVWMARPERKGSLIGKYDLRHLRWKDEEWYPHIEAEPKHVCVAKEEELIYVIHKGHLLSLPLPERWR